ncbi:hypothetical protein QQF64_010697 [Cirrhinus molitorella]|uniref:Uncharacterized protein n=1 Tax=Cirrhinus molitorella TaxID=172907 RepID=A0ABR3LX39_9TELE
MFAVDYRYASLNGVINIIQQGVFGEVSAVPHSCRCRFVRHAAIEGERVTAENQSVTGHLWVMCPRCSAADLLVFLKRLTRAHKVRKANASSTMDAMRVYALH